MNVVIFERRRRKLFASYGFESQGRWIEDRHGRGTYALVREGGGGRPTVLIHGGLSDASQWALVAGSLHGTVVIPDRPGCGLSYPIDYRGSDYRAAAAEWLLDLVDGLGAEQVDLVANSMGGFFSMAFATAHPARVRRLVLVGAPAGLDRPIPLFLRLWGHSIMGPVLTRLGITTPGDAEALRDRVFARLLVAHPERVPRDYLELSVTAGRLPGAGLAAHTMLGRVTTLRGWRPSLMMRDLLAKQRTPTLFLWGDRDRFAPPSSGRDMVDRMAAARLEVIPGAGHLPHLDEPDIVAEAVTRFLAGTATRETAALAAASA